MRQYYVYILSNRRYGILYVGVTNDLTRRMSEHQQKLADGFTKSYSVIRLVYFEQFSSLIEARARERSLKRWRRSWKLKLVDEFIRNGGTSLRNWRRKARVCKAPDLRCTASLRLRCTASGAQVSSMCSSAAARPR
jgi:putative endonuclease